MADEVPSPKRRRSRMRWLVVTAVAVALVVAGGGVWWFKGLFTIHGAVGV